MSDPNGDVTIGDPIYVRLAPPEMSLRDYFAGQVIGHMIVAAKGLGGPKITPEFLSSAAYDCADAMLKERAK